MCHLQNTNNKTTKLLCVSMSLICPLQHIPGTILINLFYPLLSLSSFAFSKYRSFKYCLLCLQWRYKKYSVWQYKNMYMSGRK